jgi:hypothetical protein
VKTGDKLLIIVRGSGVIVLRKPELPHVSIRGLARGTYPDEYLEEERRGRERGASKIFSSSSKSCSGFPPIVENASDGRAYDEHNVVC